MIFQIMNIVVYGMNKNKRAIKLETNCVNIITGQAKTGKSALIHIVDYCLGRKECNVPAGAIRKSVAWYAIKLQTSTGEIFIARKNPEIGKKSSEDIYFVRGSDIALPEADALVKNTNLETLNTLLSQSLGIADYSYETKPGQTRKPGNADIGKALFYCFQEQSEVGDQKFLFHRQGEPFIPQSIKDYLPFFLGVITNEYIQGKEKLKNLKRKLKVLEEKISENERLRGNNFEQAYALINEAKNVGLIPQSLTPLPKTWQQIGDMLKEALSKNIENEFGDPDESLLDKLFDKQQVLRDKFRDASEELNSYIKLKKYSGGYGDELKEQTARLESIGLFSADFEGHTCPLCSSSLQEEIPTVGAIKASLASTKHQLEAVTNETPHLDKLIQAAKEACERIRIEMAEIRKSIISLQKTNEHISSIRDQSVRIAMIKGRLSLYVEHMPEGEADFSSEIKEANTLKQQIIKLEKELDDDALIERISSALSVISSKITTLAQSLRIEHSDNPMRLDLKKLTVIADTEDGPIPMQNMGSGETWVALHLVTHLSLHNWFVEKSCSVPQFLFLDQPSQAYFPPDTSAETVKNEIDTENPDRQSVIKMFKLVNSETHNFQVIITEHADIQQKWFQDIVREKWWDGKTKLIPVEWLEDNA